MRSFRPALTAISLGLVAFSACSTSDRVTGNPSPIQTVIVEPDPATVTAGQSLALSDTLKDANGNILTGRAVSWESADTTKAAVSATGVVTGVAAGGPIAISATSEGKTGRTTVTITPPPVATVIVEPNPAAVGVGQTLTLSDTLKDSRGEVLTGRVVTWSSADSTIAKVSATGAVTGVKAGGPVAIMATSEGKSGSSMLTVSAASLYVSNAGSFRYGSVTIYSTDATGDAAPTSTIVGGATGLDNNIGIAVDATGRIYVANIFDGHSDSVTIYAAGATGNTAPIATISGPDTGLGYAWDIAVDAAGRIYVTNVIGGDVFSHNWITIYSAGATGNVAPIATLGGVNHPRGIAVDAAGTVYVASPGDTSIKIFAAGATLPTATIKGPNTGLVRPFFGIALDAAGNIYVSDGPTNSILVFAARATGNVAPTATFAGVNTGLDGPHGIAVDAAGRLYVANSSNNSITIYAKGATGNVAPTAVIAGASTGLNGPGYIAIWPR